MPDSAHPAALQQRRDQIRGELAAIGELRPGPLREKFMRCGKPTCRCQREDDPGHGPYFVLDCAVGGRKTTRSIPSARVPETRAQVEECQRLRRLTSELVQVSEQLCETRLREARSESADTVKKNSRRRVRRRHPG